MLTPEAIVFWLTEIGEIDTELYETVTDFLKEREEFREEERRLYDRWAGVVSVEQEFLRRYPYLRN